MQEHRLASFVTSAHPAMLCRGALAATTEPPEIFRHGTPMGLSPAEIALMALLIRRGRAAHRDIADALAGAGASASSLNVITYRIRRKFAAVGAEDPIEARRQWGLVLRVEPDARGSTSLWIGSVDPRTGWIGGPAYWAPGVLPPRPEVERRF